MSPVITYEKTIIAAKSSNRTKRDLTFSFLSDKEVNFENDKVKMTGRLQRIDKTGNTSSSIPHFRLDFRAKIKKGFPPNQTFNIPIAFKNENLTDILYPIQSNKDSGI